MAIDSEHPQYTRHKDKLTRAMTARMGEDAVKDKNVTEEFLPRLHRQDDADYADYVKRAAWYGATGQTTEAMRGIAMRIQPVFEPTSEIGHLAKSAGGRLGSMSEFVGDCLENVIEGKRAAVLVDRPVSDTETGKTYFGLYHSLDITNWRKDENSGEFVLVVLREVYEEKDEGDPYAVTEKTQYRELRLSDQVYTQTVWRQGDEGKWVAGKPIVPLMSDKPLGNIPIVFVGGDIGDPMILPLVNMERSHYRNSADYENGLHVCGLPKPYASGVTKDQIGDKMPMGTKTLLTLPDAQARLRYLEYGGQGLGEIEKAMHSKETQMARLGARMIEPPRQGVETEETARIHANTASATLVNVVDIVESGIRAALAIAEEWEGVAPGASNFTMNRDFISAEMSPQAALAAVESYLKGGMSLYSLVWKLKTGEWLAPDRTIEEEIDEIKAENPEP